MNWGDLATWATAVVALGTGILSLFFSWRALRWERASADAAVRSAEAAERANRLTERLLEREQLITRPSDEQHADVSWALERSDTHLFVLRNTGTATAEDVSIDPEDIGVNTRGLPQSATIRPGASAEFLMLGTWGNPIPNELWVTWHGQEEPVAVPMPH